jgi:DNA primase, catalytic core
MSNIPQSIIDRIKDATDIVDVIQDFVGLRKKGINYVGICPFHDDTSPSMYVSPSKQIFNCFACGTGGDVISFIEKHERLSYPEALRYLAKKYNIEIPEVELTREEIEREKRKESLSIILSRTQKIFQSNLDKSPEIQKYLQEDRGITPDIFSVYLPGYAETGNGLYTDLTKAGYNQELQIASGVVCKSPENNSIYDQQRNRITFPFLDLTGNVIGFTGRILSDDKKVAKYLNTPETDLFHKGKTLFGLFQAKQEIVRQNKAFLVEGQFDVLSMVQKGYQNTVCGSGTALTDDQVKQLKRFTSNVTLIYDGDQAGIDASFKNIKTLLSHGMKVRSVILPKGEDPDSFARKMTNITLSSYIISNEEDFVYYFYKILKEEFRDPYKKEDALGKICECISVIEENSLQSGFISTASTLFELDSKDIKSKIKINQTQKPEVWNPGFYGVEEAGKLLQSTELEESTCLITFNQNDLYEEINENPIIYVYGIPTKTQLQQLRSKINTFKIEDCSSLKIGKKESKEVLSLKEMVKEGFAVTIIDEDYREASFVDFYIGLHRGFQTNLDFKGVDIPTILDRCVELISYADSTRRTANMKEYASCLGLPNTGALKEMLKPFLAKIKDKAILENQRLDAEADLYQSIDPDNVPDYVMEDEVMSKVYRSSGFYPLLNSEKLPVAYMFKNQTGGGHTCVSDFYMVPLLHVYSKDTQANKRVIQLNHLFLKKTKYVEWQSSVFANLGKINERLIDEGAFNFDGNLQQFKKIWKTMSYNFTYCREIRVFGQQPEEFFAFSNAILHEVDGKHIIERMNDMGIVSHNKESYYAPAFSKIYSTERSENDPYEQDRFLIHKEIPEKERISFSEWANLMNEVYKINDNGKWAILFSFLCAFRDHIYTHRKYFTSLFFIGPTGSGKTQVAESIRNLFMDSNTPSFNLNTGTDAAFFMILERLRNIPIIMEEYNDGTISPVKFQGLKSATLDGEGKIKVKDVSSKTMDSSKINAIPLILGQEAAQQDDGALSNRCILRDVPYKAKGEFTEEETSLFEKLKHHEKIGLCNVFTDILKCRPLVKKYFLGILSDETKKLKEAVKINVVNTEGLTRILSAVSLMISTSKFIEKHVPEFKLPFTYEDFFQIGCNQVLQQMETISSSNKLTTYFNTISFLLNQGVIKVGKELKVVQPGRVTRLLSGKKTEEVQLTPPETKVLYVNFETIYNAYRKSVGDKDALSQSSLKKYFESNQAYIGFCKSTQFKWQVVKQVPRVEPGIDGNDNSMKQVVEWEKSNTSAYMFDYDKLKDLMNIDFERSDIPEAEEKQDQKPGEMKEVKPTGDLPF